METYGSRMDAEGMCGIRLCLLLKHHLARYDQAFMSTPAYAQFEELEVIGEGADIDAVAEYEGKQARGAVEPGGQTVGEPRMADCLHHVELLQAPGDFEADASWALMRSGSVRNPRIRSQASNGESLPPR